MAPFLKANCTFPASGDVVPADWIFHLGILAGAALALFGPAVLSTLWACLCCRAHVRVGRGYSRVSGVFTRVGVSQTNGHTRITSNTGGSTTVDLNGTVYTGRTFEVDAEGHVYVDGVCQTGGADAPRVRVTGITVRDSSVASVTTASADVTVHGSVEGPVTTASGDVEIAGSCTGSVQTTSGDVEIGGDLHGDARTWSGDIEARSARRRRGSRSS